MAPQVRLSLAVGTGGFNAHNQMVSSLSKPIASQQMNAHTAPHVSDHELSKAFHVPTPEPLEYTINMEDHEAARFNDGKNTDCWIVRKDTAIPTPVAFEAQSRREVETFYNAALAAGEKIDSGPGYRDYWSGHYAAFVYEPDGQNTEAVWYHYSKVG